MPSSQSQGPFSLEVMLSKESWDPDGEVLVTGSGLELEKFSWRRKI